MKTIFASASRIAMALCLVLLGSMNAAHAADTYVDSARKSSQVFNCGTFSPETGMEVYVGYAVDRATGRPMTGDSYYVHVALIGKGNPCAGQQAYVELVLPAGTQTAIGAGQPVKCFQQVGNGSPVQATAGCPQVLGASAFTAGALVISAPVTAQNPGGYWGLPKGTSWELLVPVRSTAVLSNAPLRANIRAFDGTASPWLSPQVSVNVPLGPVALQYPTPSTQVFDSKPPCAGAGVCRVDSDCGAQQACFCGQTVKSRVGLVSAGLGGNVVFDIGTDTSYSLAHDQAPIQPGGATFDLWSDWTPHPLVDGQTYHWRARFVSSGATTVTGSDQVFTARPSNSCAPETLGVLIFRLDQSLAFTGNDGIEQQVTVTPGPGLPQAPAVLNFALPATRNVSADMGFFFMYPSGPSKMSVESRFVLDNGVARSPWMRFDKGGFNSWKDKFNDVPAGNHTLGVEVRSILGGGPPAVVRLCGDSYCRFAPHTTSATLSASVAP